MTEKEDKFQEVTSDIIKSISYISYEDLEKEKLRNQILFNFYKMCEDYPTYLHALTVLNEEQQTLKKSSNYSKHL